MNNMTKIWEIYRRLWQRKFWRWSLLEALLLLGCALTVNYFASLYVDRVAGKYVNDLLLDNLPVVDVSLILTLGTLIFGLFMLWIFFSRPQSLAFALKSLALFIVIRSVFISLTHLGPIPEQVPIDSLQFLSLQVAGKDFFFSGHTGVPFLLALMFWQDRLVRGVALTISFVFGACVILGHFHYSIDVFAAFFITFTVFYLAKRFFPRDWQLFTS